MRVNLYGEFSNEASRARVSKGFARAFPEAQQTDLLEWGNDLGDVGGREGADADVGIYLGCLSQLSLTRSSNHKELWVMLAPNSDTVGPGVESALPGVSRLLAPSRWAQATLQKIFPEKEVLCVPHGLDPAFFPRPVPRPPGYKVLHMSSSTFARKGTVELLQGWKEADLPEAELFVSVPPERLLFFKELAEALELRNVRVTARLDYSCEGMAKLYSTMDLICQPSRGEGFGLVPLEARACGTPVVMTGCTGHSEHAAGPGVVLVETGDMSPIDDAPGAQAPSLHPTAVAEALRDAYSRRVQLSSDSHEAAGTIKRQWSWERQLKEFKDELIRKLR
jgi:glycosyltransferase involved in cell wall biosynthesis